MIAGGWPDCRLPRPGARVSGLAPRGPAPVCGPRPRVCGPRPRLSSPPGFLPLIPGLIFGPRSRVPTPVTAPSSHRPHRPLPCGGSATFPAHGAPVPGKSPVRTHVSRDMWEACPRRAGVGRGAGRGALQHWISRLTSPSVLWITPGLVWTGNGLRAFFRTHPVDGITAGSDRARSAHPPLVPRCIPRLRTVPAACLHRLSTDLCTARLDGTARRHQTVRPCDYNRVRPPHWQRPGAL
jgi:hypothetical protein